MGNRFIFQIAGILVLFTLVNQSGFYIPAKELLGVQNRKIGVKRVSIRKKPENMRQPTCSQNVEVLWYAPCEILVGVNDLWPNLAN